MGGNINDANAAATNVQATNLSILAGGRVGDADLANSPDANINAIDTEVVTVAAASQGGVYLQEVAAGGGLTVGPVAAFAVSVDVNRTNFNSTTQVDSRNVNQAALGELTTTDGPIKVTVDAGTLTIADGIDSMASGDVLLSSVNNDLVIANGAAVSSGSGHISLIAGDDINFGGRISTGAAGTIYLAATNATVDGLSGVSMQAGTAVVASTGNVRVVADNGGDILLSRITTNGHVSLLAEGSILDNNAASTLAADALAGQNQITVANAAGFAVGDVVVLQDSNSATQLTTITAIVGNLLTLADNLLSDYLPADAAFVSALNVQADALRMVADAALSNFSNQVGAIGAADSLNGIPARNTNAIDTAVNTLAAASADGIYVQEFDDVVISATGTIQVQQVRFNSSMTPVVDSSLADLVTTDAGSIKLVSVNGAITVNDGDGDAIGVQAAASVACFCRARAML